MGWDRRGEGGLEGFLDGDIIGIIVCDLVRVPGDVVDVAGELADEQKVAFSSQEPGGGGMGLRDGAGERLVVRIDEVLKLSDGCGHGEELAVEC